MTISQVKFKAAGEVPPSTGPTTAEALEMKKKIDAALEQIEEAESYNSYYTEGEKAKLEKSKAQLMADEQQLEYYLKTGDWVDVAAATAAGAQPYLANLDDVESGWYVYGANGAEPPETDENGTITVPKVKGGVTPLTFIMTSSDDESKDMVEIKFENSGNDIIATVTYADGHTESQTIKDGAIRPDIQIGVNALKSEHAVKIDASNAIVVDKATGKTSGFFIIGTKFDGDILLGSAGDGDSIHGAGGSDYLDGGAGIDETYGYAGTVNTAAGNPVSLADVYGAEALGEDGNDTIVDVYGSDFVEAGGGGNDTVIRGTASAYTTPDGTAENETSIDPSSPEMIKEWLNVSGNINSKNEYELDAGKDKNISIEVPEGYMASASTDDNDLLLTFVKQTSTGEEPEYYVVRLSGYFNQEDVTLNITGGFVDMHEVNIGLNTVNIHGTAKDGDVLIGPRTKFDELGMTAEDLGTTTYSASEIEDKLAKLQSDKEAGEVANIWDKAVVNSETGEIEFPEGTDFGEDGLDIPASLGAVAFVQEDGDDLKITVASTDGNESNRMVIRIKGGAGDAIKITVNKLGEGYVFNLGSSIGGVTIDGHAGSDLVMGYEYGTAITDPEGVEIKVKKLKEEYKTGTGPDKKTKANYSTDIGSADYAKLDSLKAEIKAGFEGDDETLLLKAIAERRAELISIDIEKLEDLKTAVENETDATKKAEKQAALDAALGEIGEQLETLQKEEDELKDKIDSPQHGILLENYETIKGT